MCDRHRQFSASAGDDVELTWEEAMSRARQRSMVRGHRQRVVCHVGPILRLWLVQDI